MEFLWVVIAFLLISARWWPWTHYAEFLGRRKILKYIAILITAQVFLALSAHMTARLYRNISFSSATKRDIRQLISIKASYTHLALNETNNSLTEEMGNLEREVEDNEHFNNTVFRVSEREERSPKNSESFVVTGDNDSSLNEIHNSRQNQSEDKETIHNHFENSASMDLQGKAASKTGEGSDMQIVKTSEVFKIKNNTSSHEEINSAENTDIVEYSSNVSNEESSRDKLIRVQQPNSLESRGLNGTLHHEYIISISGYSPVIDNKKYKFKTYRVEFPQKFILKNDDNSYFIKIGDNRTCFERGTDIDKTKQTSGENCLCQEHYYGADCGIPDAIWFSLNSVTDSVHKVRRRSIPRRIINGLPVNHEFSMFEARMHELYNVVDAFVIAESNYTAYGDPKELQFLDQFRRGYLANFQDKMVYVKLGFFSEAAKADGWLADSYIRTYMGKEGLRQIKGLRDDDIFVLSDADELPTKEVITFLKLYDGFPEPVAFGLRWNIFNFYWLMPAEQNNGYRYGRENERLTIVYSAATIGFLRNVTLDDPFLIRKVAAWQQPEMASRLQEYGKDNYVRKWVVGTSRHYAGWHCSWCFSPKDIVRKLDSAQAGDKPRWGDYPQKKDLRYITSLIWEGRWFDDQQRFLPFNNTLERFYAPPYLMKHPETYRSVLFHPSHPLNLNKGWQPG